jgi:hypothetical protein
MMLTWATIYSVIHLCVIFYLMGREVDPPAARWKGSSLVVTAWHPEGLGVSQGE